MPPRPAQRRGPAPLTPESLQTRDAVPSLKNKELADESRRSCQSLDPNKLSQEDLVAWFFFLRDANESLRRKVRMVKEDYATNLKEYKKDLDQQKALNVSLELSIAKKTDIQAIQEFEATAIKYAIVASNMRSILFEMGFASTEVSRNVSLALNLRLIFPLFKLLSHFHYRRLRMRQM